MNLWKTAILLFVIGIMLSASKLQVASSGDTIVLTPRNHVAFVGEVSDESVAAAQVQLATISAELRSSETIYLVIDSPGGSVPAGNRFIDFANSLPQKVSPICLFCASMGYHIFQSLGERLVYSSSELMSHRVSINGLRGQVPGEAVTRLNDILTTSNTMDAKVAKRIGITVQAYQTLIYDELWLNGEAAVKTNHADRIAKIRCNKELIDGAASRNVNTIFGPVDVTSSNCPLISGFLKLEYKKELTQFRSKQEAINELRKHRRSVRVQF